MTHGSLFSGIGGFDLAAEWMGWENMFHCEWNEFGQKILKYYWPNATSYGDITKTDFTIWNGRIDVLTGGFPCQPFSAAGEQLGERHEQFLLDEMLRAIFEIMPRWVVAENVYGITSPKFIRVLNKIYTSLENQGYQIQPYNIPASAVGCDHERQRIFFIAHSSKIKLQSPKPENRSVKDNRREKKKWSNTRRVVELVAGVGDSPTYFRGQSGDFEPSIIRIDDELSGELDELEAFGNAIVPEIGYNIFKTIEQYEQITTQS